MIKLLKETFFEPRGIFILGSLALCIFLPLSPHKYILLGGFSIIAIEVVFILLYYKTKFRVGVVK